MNYWDTSAIISELAAGRLATIKGVTRPHTLAEFYARTTGKGFAAGGKTIRLQPPLAAARVKQLVKQLAFVELDADETAETLEIAGADGIAGGRTHDILHIAAANKSKAEAIFTYNEKDFEPFCDLPLKHPPG
jgi:predicted nucleic acid-binding protein